MLPLLSVYNHILDCFACNNRKKKKKKKKSRVKDALISVIENKSACGLGCITAATSSLKWKLTMPMQDLIKPRNSIDQTNLTSISQTMMEGIQCNLSPISGISISSLKEQKILIPCNNYIRDDEKSHKNDWKNTDWWQPNNKIPKQLWLCFQSKVMYQYK